MSCRSIIVYFALPWIAAADEPSYPHVELSNGKMDVMVFLPDASAGYYRGVRFDGSGMVAQVRVNGHTFFEPWNYSNDLSESPQPHNTENTGDGSGTAEEFRNPLGYADAKPGDPFVKVGVGLLVRPDAQPYHFARKYELRRAAPWRITRGKGWIQFQQTLKTSLGYAYVYTKKITLEPGQASMVVTHSLRNTGRKQLATNPYCHNSVSYTHLTLPTIYSV